MYERIKIKTDISLYLFFVITLRCYTATPNENVNSITSYNLLDAYNTSHIVELYLR